MNGTEERYAALLDARMAAGEIVWWKYEAISFRLAEYKCHYHPDFMLMLPDGTIEIHETKGGFTREDAQIKLKVAASMFPFFVFRKCVWSKGEWTITEVCASQPRAKARTPEPPTSSKPVRDVKSAPKRATFDIPSGCALVNGKPVPLADALAMIQKKSA